MKLIAVYLLVALLGLSNCDGQVHYDGYKVYQVFPKTLDEANVLNRFEEDENFDFWSRSRTPNASVDIMVSPAGQEEFESVMSTYDLNYKILIEDVEETVQKESARVSRAPRVAEGQVTFEEYMRHDEINAYLRRLERDYPDIVTIEVIGRSFEGRSILLIRISSGGSNKPTIFADSAIHAREWIAPPTVLYVINQLVENPDNRALYEDVDWAIVPVANPDGYEYTHTGERFWRKTRTPGTICYGTDPNRNFDFVWMGDGASAWQCSEIYAGHIPFSEVETQAIRDYLLKHKDSMKLYLAVHSYGPYLLFPWGYTTELPEDNDELTAVAERVNDAIYAVRGTNYIIGTSTNALGVGAGGSDDYAKAVVGIELSYTVELPGGGNTGFNPPATSIKPIVEETWEGFKAYHQYIQEKFVDGGSPAAGQ